MSKFKLCLDVESINKENEYHANNFDLKIKSLAEHCTNFINGYHTNRDCHSLKYSKEFHIYETNNKFSNIILKSTDYYNPTTIKFLL